MAGTGWVANYKDIIAVVNHENVISWAPTCQNMMVYLRPSQPSKFPSVKAWASSYLYSSGVTPSILHPC
jgi:hypothetical protein